MLHDAATIEAVCDALAAEAPGMPLVADPVMVAKGGHPLLQPDAVETLKRRLLPLRRHHHPQPAGGRGADRPGHPAMPGDAGAAAGAAGAGRAAPCC